MSSNLMRTEPGGESNAYESIKTVTNPHKKSGGQLGEPETSVDYVPSERAAAHAAKGAASAEKIRYGQAMSEQGMGGQTTTSSGSANVDVGYGGGSDGPVSASDGGAEDAREARRAAGYGGDRDMDREIGA